MEHTIDNIKDATGGLKPYATWNLNGDYSGKILSLLNEGTLKIKKTLNPASDSQIIIDVTKEEPYLTSISLATISNKMTTKGAEKVFELINEYVEVNPDRAGTIFYGYANELRHKINSEKNNLVSRL